MKSFTKFFVLILAMLFTVGIVAQQQMTELEYQVLQQKAQQVLAAHGPTIDVPYSPNDVSATGDDCSDPIIITASPGMSTWSDMGQTTCGRVDDYDAAGGSCVSPSYYSNGEDLIYELVITADMSLEFNFDPVDTYSSITVMEGGCGYAGSCLFTKSGYSSDLRTFTYDFTAGTYYIQIDSWPAPDCIGFDLWIDEYIPPPPADPINVFPYMEDFSACDWPATMQPFAGSEAHAVVRADAGMEGCGALLDGNSYSGFNYPYYTCDDAFNNSPDHLSQIKMNVEPDGTAGLLWFDFDMQQYYSFGDYYSWFRVTANGTPLTEVTTGNTCFQSDNANGSGWQHLEYNLSAYQGDPSLELVINFVGKYYYLYYNGGDAVKIDNVHIWYKPVGDVEGVTYNGDLSTPLGSVEVGFLGDSPPYAPLLSDAATGYYRFNNVSTAPIDTYDMYAYMDGMNYVVQTVTFVTGGTITVNWNMAPPLMIVTPAILEETMNPNEWRSVPITITNGPTGGPLHWTAEIVFPEPLARSIDPGEWNRNVVNLPQGNAEASYFTTEEAEPSTSGNRANMDCGDESIFSAPPVGQNNAQGSEAANNWLAGQHFTTTGGKIGTVTFWGVYLSSPPDPKSFEIDFWEDGGSPTTLVASYTADLMKIETGENIFGYAIYQYYVELDTPVDLQAGWLTVQGQGGTTFYWLNTTSTTEPSWHSAGTSIGPFAMCLGPAAGGGWLDLSAFEGDVPSGESNFVNALFDATGTEAGQVWTADVNFTAQPGVSTATVNVSMIIAGDPLVPVDNFTAELTNAVTGQVDMSWSFASKDITFQYFLVRRDGAPIANTQNMTYTDYLPTYGTYNYTVSAVYAEGESTPAGPVEVVWLIPELCWTPNPVYGEVWTGAQATFPVTLENCGQGLLSFEFTGFDDPTFSNGFVTSVDPYSGVIAEGESMTVNVTFDATGYSPGTYDLNLDMATNELPPDDARLIPCEMMAYTPATLYGVVTNCDDGFPVSNVTVTATNTSTDAIFIGETDATGSYQFYVDEGTYDINFFKLSYLPTDVNGIYAPAGTMTEVNACVVEDPYPVQWVVADPNEADDACMVTWSLPMGPYEIIYDDGSAENYFAWIQYGGAVAVKFTPAGYPASVIGGRIYVGDGSFPEGANFLGSPMAVGILDDDGPGGMPGTILDSAMITCNNYGWVSFALNGTTFNDGNFYVVYWQLTIPPFSPPVGVDEQNPVVYRSYTKQAGGEWQTSAYNDFMIRATVFGPGDNVVAAMAEGPQVIPPKPTDGAHISAKMPMALPGTIKGGTFRPVAGAEAGRDLNKYKVAFVDGFDPDAGETPQDGTLNILGTTKKNYYNDNSKWPSAPAGFYAYAVQALYTSQQSIWAYSNVAAHLMDRVVTVNVSQCDGNEPSGASVMLQGYDYPYQVLVQITPATGTVVFDSVIMGMYNLSVSKLGYQSWDDPNFLVSDDRSVDVILQENTYPPRNLYVDPLTSVATWDEPLYLQVPMQGFESEPFPPAGWTSQTSGIGWERTQDGSSSFWSVPAPPAESGDWYIVANDDQVSWNNGCCDYMITPECDLRETSDYVLHFLSYYDGAYGEKATVEYSVDNGATWETLITLDPAFSWTEYNYDLSDMSGPGGLASVWFAFHADDGGAWASGWAVDNIEVGDGPVNIQGYYVYLDDGFVAQTDKDTRTYTYGDLQYGTTYTAAVAALYGCNLSDKIYYTFTSGYLYPPRNLYDEYLYGTNEVPLFWNPPMTGNGVPKNITAFLNASDDYATLAAEQNIPQVSAGNSDGLAPAGSPVYDINNPVRLNMLDNNLSYGYVAYDPAGGGTGLAEIMLDDPNSVSLFGPSASDFVAAADWVDGEYYGCIYGGTLVKYDFDNNAWVTIGSTGDFAGMAYVNNESTMYGVEFGGGLYTVDLTSGATTFVANTQGNMITMACDNDGELYGVDLSADNWGHINKETGEWTVMGPVGFDCSYAQDAGLDRATNTIFWAAYDVAAGGKLCILDTEDGSVQLVGGFPSGAEISGFAVPSSGGGGGGGVVPAGLTSFNVYQDSTLVGTALYNGEKTDEWISFVDNNVMPGTHYYRVTALYDLSVYGFPGQTGESQPDGPDTVNVVWGYDLPFTEAWDQGSFDYNGWTTTATNWVISSQNGDPAPSAQFNWDPDPGAAYTVSLASPPLNADMLSEGDIWLDFDYYLEDRNSTGAENLAVEVYNGQSWTQVAEYSNTGSFDWTPQHLKVTQYAMGRVFQVRFTAMGANSFDIVRWNVDNIEVYRTCGAPGELEGVYVWNDLDDFGSMLNWVAPEIPLPPQGWIEWDDGTNFSGIGLTDGGTFSVAARWDAGGLPALQGTSVTKIKFFPQDAGFATITVKVWEGANASTLLASQVAVSPVVGAWNEVTLDTPVPYDDTQELWIGYTIDGQPAGMFPAGTDAGPAVAGYGDKITTDGVTWDNLSDFGLDYNWNIAAYLETPAGASIALTPLADRTDYGKSVSAFSRGAVHENGISNGNRSERDFTGFNIFRQGPGESDYTLLDNVPYVEGQTSYSYYDENPYPGEYPYTACYQVTAVWEGETDYCESEPAPAKLMPIDDYVCVVITSIDNPLAGEVTSLYPNPARDRVNITSSQAMSHITIVNYVGQVVYDAEITGGNTLSLNTGSYDAGVYVVRITTNNGVVTKRMTITK